MKEKVLIEKYRGFEIYFDKTDSMFIAINKKIKDKFESPSYWEIKSAIQSHCWEETEGLGIIRDVFEYRLFKIKLIAINRATRKYKFEIVDATEKNSYKIGEVSVCKISEVFPFNKYNEKIFNQIKSLELEKTKLEAKQEKLAQKLKR